MSTPTAVAETALAAAREVARLLPAATPLEAVPAQGSAPAAGDVAVVASFVGPVSADLVLVADEAVREALAAAGEDAPVALEDALRPALEAASAVLGAGVLDATRTEPVGTVLSDDAATHLFALQHDGEPRAWFALRLRQQPAVAAPAPSGERASMRLLYDVEMTLTAELGRTRLPVRQVLELVPGSVLELDRTAGSPADVMVNGRLIARGEVVVIDEEYGIRITEIVAEQATA